VYLHWLVRIKVAVAALALALVGASGGSEVASAAHPVGNSLVSYPRGSGSSSLVLGGGRVTYGMQVLTLTRRAAPIKLLGVQLLKPHRMRLIGARVAGPHRPTYQFISDRGFPHNRRYNHKSRPVVGAVIGRPRRGWDLLVGLQVRPGRRAGIKGLAVTYRTVGHRKIEQQTLFLTYIACTAKSQLDSHGTCGPR
jgi:hypothetical protein